jgi:hypothetical protein
VLMMSQLAHSSGPSHESHTHAPLAAALTTDAAPDPAHVEQQFDAPGSHDNHHVTWDSIHTLVVVLALALKCLPRHAGWVSTLSRPNPAQISARDRSTAAGPPPLSLSVLGAGCLLRV